MVLNKASNETAALKILSNSNQPELANSEPELTQRGILNPRVVDEICPQTGQNTVDLCIYQCRAWKQYDFQQLAQNLEDKLNNYLDYLLDGYFAKQYPQYRGQKTNISLLHFEALPPKLKQMLVVFERFAGQNGLDFKTKLVDHSRLFPPAVNPAAE